jgi:hypothetical protein
MRQLAYFIARRLSSGAIVGIVIAVVAAVLSAGAAIFFYRRWKAALATQRDLYRAYTPQQRPPESATVAPTGFSSSLETSNASLMRNDTSIQAFSGRAQQPANNLAAQHDGAVPIASGSRDSRSIIDIPTQSPVDEVCRFRLVNYSQDVEINVYAQGLGRRPLPEAPGGGLSLSDEFPKLASSRRRPSMMTVDRSSIAVSEVPPPNYTQATRNAATAHG